MEKLPCCSSNPASCCSKSCCRNSPSGHDWIFPDKYTRKNNESWIIKAENWNQAITSYNWFGSINYKFILAWITSKIVQVLKDNGNQDFLRWTRKLMRLSTKKWLFRAKLKYQAPPRIVPKTTGMHSIIMIRWPISSECRVLCPHSSLRGHNSIDKQETVNQNTHSKWWVDELLLICL